MKDQKADNYGLGDTLMLERIDKLFACGVGELIDLPQIVVVGDQSSGKSSVLEGLIRKPLPRDNGLCTRFATQIIFRRAAKEAVSVAIIADRNASVDHRTRVESWTKDNLTSLDADTFSEIMTEVHQVMGLAHSEDGRGQSPTFSNDVLRLEITGPDQEHLSVIDVPGIFKNTTPGHTSKADIALVRNMVLGYMGNPRSVMLAVIPANVDVATQEILELAKDVDPEGDRTLGLLTKPDLVDKGTEWRIIDLIEGRARKMQLGWHVVRNPGQKDLSDTSLDRSSLELAFFRSANPWNNISEDKVGIESLRERLKEVLSSLVKREFPKVQHEITKRLDTAHKALEAMGPERNSRAEQMNFLTELGTKFQRLVTLALDAKYGQDEIFDAQPALRIAPAVLARMEVFAADMMQGGHMYSFIPQERQDTTGCL
ncbi:hypothetical protein M433DRAFT_8419 [Acidomyces richmondensis BFW]|nr:hypothetical protein M433DRAFT_8419 [Acidomyces richmondensis BFW]